MNWQYVKPDEIEARSFAVIRAELGADMPPLDPLLRAVLIRVIHATADFSHAQNLRASPDAAALAVQALRAGASIVTDTQMAKAGIDKKRLEKFGGQAYCFIADSDVAAKAKQDGTTRSLAAVDKAAELDVPLIFAVGNAPTALGRICDLSARRLLSPVLVIGVPVGFVNVVESKELLMAGNLPYIAVKGRKGGSNIAAAICNALLRLAEYSQAEYGHAEEGGR
ncbi:MAG: precorrin-8X methylmutase [Treponema sp.]|jgi:precorrin-8X/cobalt-precorrin-8 methylmutase|nr:precorrin-8X methylmutase [Treponema sp.]